MLMKRIFFYEKIKRGEKTIRLLEFFKPGTSADQFLNL